MWGNNGFNLFYKISYMIYCDMMHKDEFFIISIHISIHIIQFKNDEIQDPYIKFIYKLYIKKLI